MYEFLEEGTFLTTPEGERTMLANFTAKITLETKYFDGMTSTSFFEIEGQLGKQPLEPITISADEFASMHWVIPFWGPKLILGSGGGIKDNLRMAIQLNSSPKTITIYKHTGWTEIGNKWFFLTANGGIGTNGLNKKITVSLPVELSNYSIEEKDKIKSAMASFELPSLPTPKIGWPLFAGTFAPLFGPCDFGIHLAGRTGTFKSELLSLFLAHYGPKMDSRHLPCSWSSTANALEAQTFFIKNAPIVIDDFVPSGTAWQIRSYQQTADKIFRAQGNQAGRARLTDNSRLQQTFYPRGLILSSGEDIPQGHSCRARMLILEISPGDVDPKKLSAAQSKRDLYQGLTFQLIKHLAKSRDEEAFKLMAESFRDENLGIGHTRTPAILGYLLASIELTFKILVEAKILTENEKRIFKKEAFDMIIKAASEQNEYLETADPCDIFIATLKQIFASGLAHARTLNGGIPANPTQLGWTNEGSDYSEIPSFKSHGPCIAWARTDENELYIDSHSGFNMVKKISSNEIPLTKQTLLKRLKEAGIMKRNDETRQRNTIRITCDNGAKTCACILLSKVLEE